MLPYQWEIPPVNKWKGTVNDLRYAGLCNLGLNFFCQVAQYTLHLQYRLNYA